MQRDHKWEPFPSHCLANVEIKVLANGGLVGVHVDVLHPTVQKLLQTAEGR